MLIRNATSNDSEDIREVLLSSIKSCVADHKNDHLLVEKWTINKTVENICLWVNDLVNITFVATDNDKKIVGIALLNAKDGRFRMCYVSSDYHGKGIGTMLIESIEHKAVERGITKITLNSTKTAYKFYLKHGYISDGMTYSAEFGRHSYFMHKDLFSHKLKS